MTSDGADSCAAPARPPSAAWMAAVAARRSPARVKPAARLIRLWKGFFMYVESQVSGTGRAVAQRGLDRRIRVKRAQHSDGFDRRQRQRGADIGGNRCEA